MTKLFPEFRCTTFSFVDCLCPNYGNSLTPDGRNYVGEWKDGELHGQGTMTWSNGIRYEGE